MKKVIVIDLDETIGHFENGLFNVRPKVDFLINFLKYTDFHIILWSYGDDQYVESIVNGYLPIVCSNVYKMFGRTQCRVSEERYDVVKCSEHVRKMFPEDVLLIGVDDRANAVMDDRYDMRVQVASYNAVDLKDTELVSVVEKILNFCVAHC